jgi:hypothetical protein
MHLNPLMGDHSGVLADAQRYFPGAVLGEDGAHLQTAPPIA